MPQPFSGAPPIPYTSMSRRTAPASPAATAPTLTSTAKPQLNQTSAVRNPSSRRLGLYAGSGKFFDRVPVQLSLFIHSVTLVTAGERNDRCLLGLVPKKGFHGLPPAAPSYRRTGAGECALFCLLKQRYKILIALCIARCIM